MALERRRGLDEALTPPLEFARRIRERFFGFEIVDATPALTELRMVKTAYERKLLIRSLEISSEAQIAGMRAARPGAFEYEVKAAIEAVHRARGAVSWSYPSIVGSGPNATILHYQRSSRQMQAGELLLVDAAANYQGLTGDITRTYPVSGRFSAPQREIYEVVLSANRAATKTVQAGNHWNEPHEGAVRVLTQGLKDLGLLTGDVSGHIENGDYRRFYMHRTGHWLGMDVHDVGDYKVDDVWRLLEPGMVLTVEPGLYIAGRGGAAQVGGAAELQRAHDRARLRVASDLRWHRHLG
jgi:Xaa-Pro aminopeptidase